MKIQMKTVKKMKLAFFTGMFLFPVFTQANVPAFYSYHSSVKEKGTTTELKTILDTDARIAAVADEIDQDLKRISKSVTEEEHLPLANGALDLRLTTVAEHLRSSEGLSKEVVTLYFETAVKIITTYLELNRGASVMSGWGASLMSIQKILNLPNRIEGREVNYLQIFPESFMIPLINMIEYSGDLEDLVKIGHPLAVQRLREIYISSDHNRDDERRKKAGSLLTGWIIERKGMGADWSREMRVLGVALEVMIESICESSLY